MAMTVRAEPLSAPHHARQATLHTASRLPVTALQVLSCTVPPPHQRGITRQHENRSPQRQERILHAIGERPEAARSLKTETFPPAPTPNWAFKASTTGFIDMPFKGFLGPSWEPAALTRILRRWVCHKKHTPFCYSNKFSGKIQCLKNSISHKIRTTRVGLQSWRENQAAGARAWRWQKQKESQRKGDTK